jgi:hypothetical protein
MDLLKLDSWVNPTKRDFTPEEAQRIKQFVAIDGLLALELDREFHRQLAVLGESRLAQGRIDGEVDLSLLTTEQASALPRATKDWFRPVYFSQRGSMYTWAQLDLPTEAPELARLLQDERIETELARKRLREFVLSLK